MKISILAVGRIKSGPEQQQIEEYIKRLPWKVSIIEVEEKRPLPRKERMEKEGEKLAKMIPQNSYVIAMDKSGTVFSSKMFSQAIQKWNKNSQDLVFLIGGADGLAPDILSKADFTLSMGKMTWPHFLARIMLAEQLYRAHTILINHPYHK